MPPEIEIMGGNPSPDEERAVREAILTLWRVDQAEAAKAAGGMGGWIRAAREEGTGASLWRSSSWRGALGMTQRGALPPHRVGRGDQR